MQDMVSQLVNQEFTKNQVLKLRLSVQAVHLAAISGYYTPEIPENMKKKY